MARPQPLTEAIRMSLDNASALAAETPTLDPAVVLDAQLRIADIALRLAQFEADERRRDAHVPTDDRRPTTHDKADPDAS